MPNNFTLLFDVSDVGALKNTEAKQLSLEEISNYSLVGQFQIKTDQSTMLIVDVPLLQIFHAVRQTLNILPTYTAFVPYVQMFRDARTTFKVCGDILHIRHYEVSALRERAGASALSGSYVDFCQKFGTMTREFLSLLEDITPSIFADSKSQKYFHDLFVAREFMKKDAVPYSII